jgi:hypothetical protein
MGYKDTADEILVAMIDGCPNLQSVELSNYRARCQHFHSLHTCRNCRKITDVIIIKIAERCTNLHTLKVTDAIVSDKSIIMVGDSCPNLHNLNLQGCGNITDSSILRVAEGCPELRSLNISGEIPNSIVTDASVIRLADKCPKLNSLNLRNCTNITDASMVRLSKGCPDIHTLQTYNCHGVTMKLKKLREIFPYLKYFI